MTSGNAELVRRIYEDWARGDFSPTGWADPEIEFVLADGPSPGSWSGIEEMARAWSDAMAAFDGFRAIAESCEALDGERVLVLTRNTGRGKTSGLELGAMETRGANVFHVRDGKVTRLVAYWERDRALSDLSLPHSWGLTP